MNAPTAEDRADWRAVRDLPRSRVGPVLQARATARGLTPGKLRARLIAHYGQEAEMLPAPAVGRPPGPRVPKTLANLIARQDQQ